MTSVSQRVSAFLAVLSGGILLLQVDAQPYHLSPSGVQQVNEGGSFVFNCTVETGSPPFFIVFLDDSIISSRLSAESIPMGSRFTFGPIASSDDGSVLRCTASNVFTVESATLDVTFRPRFSPTMAMATPTEGERITFSFQLSANPPPNITLTRSSTLVTDVRVTVNTTSLTIADVTRDDSGEYQITASNVAGSGTFTLTVDVYYPPEFTVPSQNVTRNAARNEVFTFDCTPSGGNPAVYSYTFLKGSVPVTEGVSGSVLTYNPVVRSSRGMYTCTANNTAGTAVVTWNLFVVDVPTRPLNPRVVDLMPFSATLQWDPPSDNGGFSLPLTYTVTLTDTSTSLPFSDITATSLPLPNLQHSTRYSWSVQAINEYGSSPPAEATFTTPDSVPIVDSVDVAVLRLFEVEVNISLLTNRGQSVTQYIVEVNGTNYTFPSSEQMHVSLLVNELNMNFTMGKRFTLRVFAVNSVGTSDPVSADVIVPSPPSNIAPTELDPGDIPVCCAGVLLSDDPSIQVRVLVNGMPYPPNQTSREGSFLYIMGLQAGTEYSLRIALTNIFGTVWINTTVRPLLGRSSTPEVALTPTAGRLTVQLTVMYPGTREDTLQYSISTSPSPLSRRQTGQQPLPVTDLTTPTSGSAELALGPGTYSVTVTVTNKHGSTTAVPQQATIPGSCPESTNQTSAVTALIAVLVVVILLLAVAIVIIALQYIRIRKLTSVQKDGIKNPNSNYDDLEMEPQSLPKSGPSKSTIEPQYEVCGGGVTSSDVTMDENPAYQSVAVPGTRR